MLLINVELALATFAGRYMTLKERLRVRVLWGGEMSARDDRQAIDALTRAFFGVFSNRDGKRPGLDVLYELCLPEAVIVKTCADAPTIYNLREFIEPRARLLNEGSLREFFEEELAERTDIFGNVAQRFCSYRKSGFLDGEPFEAKGMKCLQFVKSSGRWLISAVAWDDERDGNLVSM
jgi:hypothetical protein